MTQQFAILVEGPDGAGKTTLINKLTSRFGVTDFTHHGTYLGESNIAQIYLNSLLSAWHRRSDDKPYSMLLDRSWLAEPIYGAVMRDGENRVTTWQRRMLERTFLGLGGVVVLCIPPFETCLRNWSTRREREYPDSRQKLRAIFQGYYDSASIWYRRGLPVLLYDYEVDPSADAFIEMLRCRIELYRNEGPGAGGWNLARWLLIGDKPNSDDAVSRYQVPFVSTHEGGCSAWLTEKLEAWDIRECNLHLVNQYHVKSSDFAVFGGITRKFGSNVVALGRSAELWCDVNNIESFHTLPHPQFWKRFHFHEEYPLKDIFHAQLTTNH